jgi:hypothetical protein
MVAQWAMAAIRRGDTLVPSCEHREHGHSRDVDSWHNLRRKDSTAAYIRPTQLSPDLNATYLAARQSAQDD